MKRFISFLFVFLFVFGSLLFAQQNNTNFVLHGANNVASWSAKVSTDTVASGQKSIRVEFVPGNGTQSTPALVLKEKFTQTPIQSPVIVRWKALVSSLGKPNAVISFKGSGGQSTTLFVALTKGSGWQQYEASLNISGFAVDSLFIGINSSDMNGRKTAFFDDITAYYSNGSISVVENGESQAGITPGIPNPTTPADGATNFALNGGTLNWSAVAPVSGGIISYNVQVSTSQAFASFVVNQNITGATSVTLSNLTTNTIYYWRVSANEGTQTSGYSAVRSFSTGVGTVVPDAPTLGAPADGTTGFPLSGGTLNYASVSGISGYQLELRENSQTGTLVNNQIYTASPIVLNNLKPNTIYWWRLGSVGTSGIGWSGWRSFTTVNNIIIAKPIHLSPANNSTGMVTPISFVWTAVQNILNYELQISKTNTFSSLEYSATPPQNYQNVSILYASTLYYWRVRGIGSAGVVGEWSDPWTFMIGSTTDVGDQNNIPAKFELMQNYPNPFNPATSIKYSVSSIQYVRITVFDILGREIVALVNEQKTPGRYEVQFDGSKLSSGIYIYKFQAGNFSATKKMILMK